MVTWLGWGLAAALLAAEPNLLTNSDFETLAEPGRPAAWSLGGQATLLGDERVHGGRTAVRVRFDDNCNQTVPVRAGEWYVVEGWCRADNPATAETPRVKLHFLDSEGKRLTAGGGFIEGVTARAYTPFAIAFTAPPPTSQVIVSLIGEYNGSDWFLFDDVSVRLRPIQDRPALAGLPDLHQKTVVVPDRADVRSSALYRIPYVALSPIDGDLSTAAWTHRTQSIKQRLDVVEFDLKLARPSSVSWVLLHGLNPLRPIRKGQLRIGETTRPLPEAEAMVHSMIWPRTQTDRALLTLSEVAADSVEINEIQLLDLRDGAALSGSDQPLTGSPTNEDVARLAARFAQADNRQALATGIGGATATVSLPANRPLSLVAHHPQRTGLRGVQLTLALAPLARDEVIELAVKQPAELDTNVLWAELTDRGETSAASQPPRHFRDICRVYSRRPANATGLLTVAFDLPDLVLEAGEGLFLELRCPSPLSIDPARSALRLETCSPEQARAEYLPRLERLMRWIYSAETEAHPYGGRPYRDMVLNRYVQRVLAEDPDNRAATSILCRIAARLPSVSVARPGPAEAPDWAVWGRHAQREWYRVADWWLDNRWVPYGELGGNLNDDVEYTCHWPLAYLITGDDRLRAAQGAIADAIWEQSGGSGYSIAATDVEHAAEDSSCSLPQMMLCEYGSPVHVERMMRMSEHVPTWTGINSKGRRHFRSYIFNAKMVSQQPKQDIDHLYCALAMVGPTHLSWYNRHPLTTQWTTEYATAWAEAGLSTAKGKPAGALPCDIRYSDGELFPYTDRYNLSVYYSFGDYVMKNLLIGAQRLGLPAGEALPAICSVIEGTPQDSVARATKALETFASPPAAEPGKPYAAEKSWRDPSGYEWHAWRATVNTGDKKYLNGMLAEVAREFERTRFLITEAEPFTDRVPVPGTTLLRYMFLGGDVAGKTHVPGLAVSWEQGGTDFAALVLEASESELKALVYRFAGSAGPTGLRVWRLAPGSYRVRIGIDTTGDDTIDTGVTERTMTLRRYSLVPLDLPVERTTVVEITQLSAAPPAPPAADLAICPADFVGEGGQWQVTVHNLGTAASTPALLRALDATGKPIAEATIPAIPAPLDLSPKTARVAVPAATASVVIDLPDDAEPANNAAAPASSGYRLR